MDRIQSFVPRERSGDLLRRRQAAVEHDRPNLRPEIAESRVEIRD
jgi:hypothetical protein